MIAPNWPLHVSNLSTTNQVDTDVNNDDNSQCFETPRKNHRATEMHDTNTTATMAQVKSNPPSMLTDSFNANNIIKIPPSRTEYL